MNERPSNVVDFLEFRAARDRSRLPLFDGTTEVRTLPDLTERPLSTAGVQHRARMLKHLGDRLVSASCAVFPPRLQRP